MKPEKVKKEYAFKIGCKVNRGRNAGKRFTDTVYADTPDGIYDILWAYAMRYAKGRGNTIIEWHSPIK
jgi:hypothetical protein